jgi:hypothetical protein
VINYALICNNEHKFEAWFKNAQAYEEQAARGVLICPVCDSHDVQKQIMAPSIARTGTEKVSLSIGHPEHRQLRDALRALRKKVESEADYVGDKFAEEARKIHFKEVDPRGIYGEATREETAALLEDGVDFMPLPNIPEDAN